MIGAMAVGATYGVDVRRDTNQAAPSAYKQQQMYVKLDEVRMRLSSFSEKYSFTEASIVQNVKAHGFSRQ